MQRPTNKSAAIIILAVVLLPVVYVLSTGPAVWPIHHGLVDEGWVHAFYSPFNWAMERLPTCDAIMQPYLSLWDGRAV